MYTCSCISKELRGSLQYRSVLLGIAAMISCLSDNAAQHSIDHEMKSSPSHHPAATNSSIPRTKSPLVSQSIIIVKYIREHCLWLNQALSVEYNKHTENFEI